MSIDKLKITVKSKEELIQEMIWDGDFEEWMLFGGEIIEAVDEYKQITINVEKE